MRRALPALLLLCSALAACGGSGPAGGAGTSFEVQTPGGISLVQHPFAGEAAVRGLIAVTRGDAAAKRPVPGAAVKLDGVAIPESSLLTGFYDLSGATGLAIGPGGAATLTASEGPDAATVSFACPPEVALQTPSDHATASGGQVVSVTWTGRVGYSSRAYQPSVYLRPWDPVRNLGEAPYQATSAATPYLDLAAGASSALLTVPADGKSGYVVELAVPGNYADQSSTGGQAICLLVRRARLTAQ